MGALVWAAYRRHLCAGGNRVMWPVQQALDSSLRPGAMAELAESTRKLEAADDADTTELDVARAELAQIIATNIGPVKILPCLVGFGQSYVEHCFEEHPQFEEED